MTGSSSSGRSGEAAREEKADGHFTHLECRRPQARGKARNRGEAGFEEADRGLTPAGDAYAGQQDARGNEAEINQGPASSQAEGRTSEGTEAQERPAQGS